MATAVAEVSLCHSLLKVGAELVCSLSNHEGDVENIFRACCEDVLTIDHIHVSRHDGFHIPPFFSFIVECVF